MSSYAALLDLIVADAVAKGASIRGWHSLANGKIVIDSPPAPPRYHISAFAAADSLIHRYNLVAKYRYLYRSSVPINVQSPQEGESAAKDQSSDEKRFEKRACEYCDQIFLHPTIDFTPRHTITVYHAIDKAHTGRHLSKNDFLILTSFLLNHYNDLHADASTVAEKEKIRKAIRFFTKIKYREYVDSV